MKTQILQFFFLLLSTLLLALPSKGQRAATDHNSSRSNNTAQAFGPGPQWSFGFFTGASTGLKTTESNLFRGQGFSGRLSGDYFFGRLGLGLTSGFVSGNMNLGQINAFLLEKQLPQERIDIRSNPFNAYLLGGPSLRIGNNLQLIASIKGGLFYNQVGGLSVGPEGSFRTFYGFESGSKPWQFGFSSGVSLSYNIGMGTALMLSTELLHTQTQVQVLDLTQGIDIPTIENRSTQVLTAGVTLVKRFGMGGEAFPERNHAGAKYDPIYPWHKNRQTASRVEREIGVNEPGVNRAAQQGNNRGYVVGKGGVARLSENHSSGESEPVSRSLLPPQHRREIGVNEPGVNRAAQQGNNRGYVVGKGGVARLSENPSSGESEPMSWNLLPQQHRRETSEPARMAQEPCGPVTHKITHPDGTVEEVSFACPEDAASYAQKVNGGMPNRISMNVTVPRQTQGATFGERVNAGLQHAGNASTGGASVHIISGRIVRTAGNSNVGVLTNAGSGAAAASYAATGRAVNQGDQNSFYYGPAVNLYAREASSGMASGRRSRESGSGQATGRRGYDYYQSRDAASGQSTGRRQYQPVFFDGQNPGDVCNPCLVVVNNPLYSGSGNEHQNPLAFTASRSSSGPDEDCDGIAAGLEVSLIDKTTGIVVSTTRTNACGEYWFANVPQGVYGVQVDGEINIEKRFPVTISGQQRMDIAVQALVPHEQWRHFSYFNPTYRTSGGGGAGKATFKDFTLVLADDDGDGLADRYRATGRLTDGTSRDLSDDASQRSGGGKASMQDFHFSAFQTGGQAARGGRASMSDLHFSTTGNEFRAMATFSDGKKQDVSEYVEIQQRPGVLQVHFSVIDTDDDGHADIIWSPRSNFGASAQSAKVSLSDLHFTKPSDSHSFHLNVASGDLDGDGAAEILIGNLASELAFLPASASQPGGESARPGNPIGGLTIKAGRNPGGNIVASGRTNDVGEFEFAGLDPGEYTIAIETVYRISDEVIIDFRDMDSDDDGVSDRIGQFVLQPSQNSQSLRLDGSGNLLQDERAFNQNSSRSNNARQTENSSSDNRRNLPVRWSAPEVLWNGIGSILSSLDDLDEELEGDMTSNRSGINTSRSNIKNYLGVVEDLSADIVRKDARACQQRALEMNAQFLALQQSLQTLGSRYQTISNVLKTKHDTVKNSIQNIR